MYDNLRQYMERVGETARAEYRASIAQNKATGRLYDNVGYEVYDSDDKRTYTTALLLEYWWRFLEKGTRPHRPPYAPLLQWVKVKGIQFATPKGVLTPERTAWCVVKGIEKKGTAPKKGDTLDTITARNVDEWMRGATEAISKDIYNYFENGND